MNKSITKGLPYLKHSELIAFWLGGGVGEVVEVVVLLEENNFTNESVRPKLANFVVFFCVILTFGWLLVGDETKKCEISNFTIFGLAT